MEKIVRVIGESWFDNAREEWQRYGCQAIYGNLISDFISDLSLRKYCLVVLMKEYLNGGMMEALKEIRDATSIPILIITSEYNADEKIQAIRLGADEYLSTPHTTEEAVLSGVALIRRYTYYSKQDEAEHGILSAGNILVLEDYYRVYVSGKEVHLTPTEFKVLVLFMKNRKRLLTYNIILQRIWGEGYEDSSHNLVWHQIKKLKRKLRASPDEPEYIVNVHNVGYRFDP